MHGGAALLNVDESSPAQPQPAHNREIPKARRAYGLRVEVDPKLEAILQGWAQASSQIHRLDCNFSRFRYDPTFQIEHRGTGSLAVDQDGRAAYRIVPAT